MSQIWTDNSYQLDHTGTTDLQAIENNLNTLKSSFSGATTPSNNVAGMLWFDTTNTILKVRNNANSAWLGVLYGPATLKTWIYANAATDGWAIDSSVTDAVLSLKGGSQAYNANGGTEAGTWTQPSHALITAELPSHTHSGTTGGGGAHTHTVTFYSGAGGSGQPAYDGDGTSLSPRTTSGASNHTHAFTTGGTGSGTAHNHGTTHRPAAAIGTLQYPDV